MIYQKKKNTDLNNIWLYPVWPFLQLQHWNSYQNWSHVLLRPSPAELISTRSWWQAKTSSSLSSNSYRIRQRLNTDRVAYGFSLPRQAWFLLTLTNLWTTVKALLLVNGSDLCLNWTKGLSVRNPPTKQPEITRDSNPGTFLWGNELFVQIAVKFHKMEVKIDLRYAGTLKQAWQGLSICRK